MTTPIQQNHYAIGFTYKHKNHGQVIYMGDVMLEDGSITHIFAHKFCSTETNRQYAMGVSEHDDWASDYISDDF